MATLVDTIDTADSYFTSSTMLTASIQGIIRILTGASTHLVCNLVKLSIIRENGSLLRDTFVLTAMEEVFNYSSSNPDVYRIILRKNENVIDVYRWTPNSNGSYDVNPTSTYIGSYANYWFTMGY